MLEQAYDEVFGHTLDPDGEEEDGNLSASADAESDADEAEEMVEEEEVLGVADDVDEENDDEV